MQDLFFTASKTIGLAARAETWLLLALALGLVAFWRGRLRRAAVWLTGVFLALLTLTTVPLGDFLLVGLESQYLAHPAVERVDDIIVLGGDEDINAYRRWGDVQVNEAGERLIAGVVLARRFPQARLIYTGGTASLRSDKATDDPSQMMYDAWVALGVDPARIVLERASRNTSENARMTMALVQPQPGQVHLLVTSAFHMPRSIETFTRAGWTGLVAWPVDFRSGSLASAPTWTLDKNLSDLDTGLKEVLGLWAYRIAGQ